MPLAEIQTAFSGNPLDRADYLRTDPEIFGEWMDRDDARVVLFAGEKREDGDEQRVKLMGDTRVLTDEGGDILWQKPSSLRFLPVGTTLFLGLEDEAPRFASMLEGAADDFTEFFGTQGGVFRDARTTASMIARSGETNPTLGIISQAKSMLSWHASHRFCAQCGAESTLVKAGYERECPSCGAKHFPRTDPVVIMLVRSGDKALVGRGAGWPEGFFSALAGYMEPGEDIEEAVAREIWEEVGLKTSKVTYKASQPWPWPSTLMIGCEAWVDDGDIRLQESELAEAIWITKDDVLASRDGNHPHRLVPPPFAIAHNLIMDWINE